MKCPHCKSEIRIIEQCWDTYTHLMQACDRVRFTPSLNNWHGSKDRGYKLIELLAECGITVDKMSEDVEGLRLVFKYPKGAGTND